MRRRYRRRRRVVNRIARPACIDALHGPNPETDRPRGGRGTGFSLDLRAGREHAIATGDRFGRHAKQDVSFDKHARRDRTAALHAHHRDEIEVALAYCERVWGCDPCRRLAGDLLETFSLPHHGPGMQEASDDLR